MIKGFALSFVLSLMFISIGGFFLIKGLEAVEKSKATYEWVETDAKIIKSFVKKERKSSSSGGSTTSHIPKIVYNYKVNGESYKGDKIAYVGFSKGKTYAQEVISRYPKGSSIKVYYNPDNFEEVVAERGKENQAMMIPILGCGAIFTGFIIILISYSTSKNNKQVDSKITAS